jgi:hypothetical protein
MWTTKFQESHPKKIIEEVLLRAPPKRESANTTPSKTINQAFRGVALPNNLDDCE